MSATNFKWEIIPGLFTLTQKELTQLSFRDFHPSIYSRRVATMHLIGNTVI